MRSPVYRNLDRPFQVYGFSVLELTLLSAAFVGGGELAQSLGIRRIWAFLLTFKLANGMHSLRRALGEMFALRLLRYLELPNQVQAKLFAKKETP
jgi:hypothetical protein